jgi:hypothetical protein
VWQIQECEREEQYDEFSEEGSQTTTSKATPVNFIDKRATPKHHPTPLREKKWQAERQETTW